MSDDLATLIEGRLQRRFSSDEVSEMMALYYANPEEILVVRGNSDMLRMAERLASDISQRWDARKRQGL